MNIYSYIENFTLTSENFLEFVTTLCEYFSQRFGVRNCAIKIRELEPMDSCVGKAPPAKYCSKVKIHIDKKTGEETYERLDEAIEFSLELTQGRNLARAIKLAAHEWMHFYDALFRWKELGEDKIDQQYKKLILKSHQYDKNRKEIREKYQDLQTFAYIDKLSAKETVADKFAQDFLKELYANTSNEKLKKQIEKQIEKHEEQVAGYMQYLQEQNVTEEYIIQ